MRKKLLNNNLTGSISKGGVLYRAGEIPTLTTEQKEQAKLVSRLPNDFPFADWEGMTTKQQLRQMQNSGLNAQEQWSLLNTNVPLAVLNEHNHIQTQSESTALAARVAASLVSTTTKSAVPPTPTPGNSSSNYAPLLGGGVPQKTNTVKEEYKKSPIGKASGNASGGTGGATPKKTTMEARAGSGIAIPDSTPTITPQVFTLETEPPSPTPIITPTPSPIPTPSPKPTPTPTSIPTHFLSLKAGLREALTNRAILANKGVEFATLQNDKPYSNTYRYGPDSYDCSGLVIAMCTEIGSKLPFGTGIRKTCQYGMSADFRSNPEYGSVVYNHEISSQIQYLQKGDLIFYANPSNMNQDAHVAIVTGNVIYDSETNTYWPEVIEASGVARKVTKYPAFNIQENGEYSREHSRQVVTYVIRPNYDWEEQP